MVASQGREGGSGALGDFLRTCRQRADRRFSQEEVARRAGLSTVYVQKMEQNRAGNPSPAVLERIAIALDLDADERTRLLALRRSAVARLRLTVRSPDRVGLVRDLTKIVAQKQVSLTALATIVQGDIATVWLTLAHPLPEQTSWIIEQFRHLGVTVYEETLDPPAPRPREWQRALDGAAALASAPDSHAAPGDRRVLPVVWPGEEESTIVVDTFDRPGLVHELAEQVASAGLTIRALSTASDGTRATIWITIQQPRSDQWPLLWSELRAVKGVRDVVGLVRRLPTDNPSAGRN